jgi:hypothetical protein
MSTEDTAIYVTPEWLLNHGFVQYKSPEETEIHDIPFHNYDDQHFVEKEFARNMFVVVFSPSLEHDGHLHHQIWVQEDAGCGFVPIPEMWWFLPIEYLQSIYYGIRGEYLKPTKRVKQ